MEALVTVQLQLCSDLLFSFSQAESVSHELCGLLGTCFIGDDAVVIEIPDYGQIQNTFARLDIGNIRYPLLIWTLRVEISVEEIGIAAQMIGSSAISFSPSDIRKQAVCLHDSQDGLFVEMDAFFPLQPDLDSPVAVGPVA